VAEQKIVNETFLCYFCSIRYVVLVILIEKHCANFGISQCVDSVMSLKLTDCLPLWVDISGDLVVAVGYLNMLVAFDAGRNAV
jgi:hypothetical protein